MQPATHYWHLVYNESIHTEWQRMNPNVLCSPYLCISAFFTWWTLNPPARPGISSPREGFLLGSFLLQSEVGAPPLWAHRVLPSEHSSVCFPAYLPAQFRAPKVRDKCKGESKWGLWSQSLKLNHSSTTCCVSLRTYFWDSAASSVESV